MDRLILKILGTDSWMFNSPKLTQIMKGKKVMWTEQSTQQLNLIKGVTKMCWIRVDEYRNPVLRKSEYSKIFGSDR